jgi:zinc protease
LTIRRVLASFGSGALLAVSISSGGSSAQPATRANDTPTIKYEKYTLPNGLDVILSENHRLPLVSVDVWYHVGPANEVAGRTGFAHLFEHMMFEGSKHVKARVQDRMLEGAGATNYNGTTNFDRTNYFESVPANQLELGLWLESDRMGYLLDALDQAKLSNQQDVVRNERRQSLEGRPYGIVEEGMYHLLFPKTHPYYANVIGSHADIQAAKLEDVKNFFKLYYAPNNASLAIVGDFDPAQAKAMVERYFGPLKRGTDVPKVTVTTPPITAERKATIEDHVELPRVYMAWITSPRYKPGDADAHLASLILGGGMSSRLYKSLVYDKQIAHDVNVSQDSLTLGSVFEIVVTARPGHTAEEIQKAVDDELTKLRDQGPDQKELERAQNLWETRMLTGLEVMGGFGGVADALNRYNYFVGNPGYLGEDLARHRRATVATVKQFADDQLATNARVVVYGVPGQPDLGPNVPTPPAPKVSQGNSEESVNADASWRSQAPTPAAERPLHLPAPTSFTLANGLTVLLSPGTDMPIVTANLVFKTGSDVNPLDKPGLASFTSAMLKQGTATRSALQIADDTAQLGASLDASASTDSSTVSARSLRKNFGATLDLMADVALHANFPTAEVERQRASRLGDLVQAQQRPGTVATMSAKQILYGPMHAYGFTDLGTTPSVKGMTREDLQGYWQKNFVPNNAALVVSGPITEGELRPLVESAFGSWTKGTPGGPAPDTRLMPGSARITVVDKPGAPQTSVLVGEIGVPRSTPDYPSVSVMNAILGGLFSSRVNLNLREDHGYTYGASSYFVFGKGAGPFFVGSAVRTDVTAPAVSEIFKEVKRIIDAPITDAELTMGRDALSRSLPGNFETTASTVASVDDLYVYDLGLDFYAKFPAALAAVTEASVQAAAKAHLHPDEMIVVCVGDRAKIEPGLAKLALGTIAYRNPDGTPKR